MGLQARLIPHRVMLSQFGTEEKRFPSEMSGRILIGVLHAGGAAPASNAAIKGIVATAILNGACVIGFEDGFEGLRSGSCVFLTRELVNGIEGTGGIALGTSRFNPHDDDIKKILANLKEWGIAGLIGIGGDDTNTTLSRFKRMGFPVVGIPKTIDNDLPGEITHGFTTFVHYCSQQLKNLKSDAEAQDKPSIFIAEIMGRSSGALTLASGRAGEATAIFIPEEFTLTGINQIITSDPYPAKDEILKRIARMVEVDGKILDVEDFKKKIEGLSKLYNSDPEKANSAIKLNMRGLANEIVTIVKNAMNMDVKENGSKYGVFAVAEGITNRLSTEIVERDANGRPLTFEIKGLSDKDNVIINADDHGNPRLQEVKIGAYLEKLVAAIATKDYGFKLKVVSKPIGYELRCQAPVAFDVNLGLAEGSLAANLLLQGKTGVMVLAKANGDVTYGDYENLPRDKSGHIVPRVVDLSKLQYINAVGMQMYERGTGF
jgi:6-phosphofructokinase